jgi:hypothetical protein
MNLDFALGLLAALGVLLLIIGRWTILHEARAVGIGWVFAIRFLPLADLMFLARFWDSAKTGAFLSIAGLTLAMPYGAKALWDRKHSQQMATRGSHAKSFGGINSDSKGDLLEAMRGEQMQRIARKQEKLQKLGGHMTAWYQSMESRRALLDGASPSEITAFNEEAAAYTALNTVMKDEVAELAGLQSRKLSSISDVSDDEFRAFQDRFGWRPRGITSRDRRSR